MLRLVSPVASRVRSLTSLWQRIRRCVVSIPCSGETDLLAPPPCQRGANANDLIHEVRSQRAIRETRDILWAARRLQPVGVRPDERCKRASPRNLYCLRWLKLFSLLLWWRVPAFDHRLRRTTARSSVGGDRRKINQTPIGVIP